MYRLEIMAEAARELEKEVAYSARHWGRGHGIKYGRELRQKIGDLRHAPLLYPQRDDILPGVRIKTYKGNRIVYAVREEEKLVVVLAVLSIHQSLDKAKLEGRRRDA